MTEFDYVNENADIIPYQELLGNYDDQEQHGERHLIIPYQELLGNYDGYRSKIQT